MNPAAVQPFVVDVSQADLDDLRDRIRRTRWPEAETVDDWSQGVPLEYLQRLCAYWVADYDCRRVEQRLNAWPQHRTVIDGLAVHFLHARSPHPQARPLLLTHGWPGSVLEFAKLVPSLTNPEAHGGAAADACHVVIPSLPGYGFSDRPSRSGWGIEKIAEAWAELMARLDYPRYVAAGSEWGTSITAVLAGQDPDHVAGVHLIPPLAPPDPATRGEPTECEQRALADLAEVDATGAASGEIHRTRPQTIGYGLVDSPVALCAWLAEKYHAWGDRDVASALTDDDVLDAVTLYWLTGTGASSARLYWESIGLVRSWFTDTTGPVVPCPVGASIFEHENPRVSQRWARRRFPNIRLWRHHDRGGHFAALEVPDLVVADLRDLIRNVW